MLVRRAKKGDKDAFLELMLLHKEYLYRTAFLYTRNQDMACDAVQECIVKSMEAIGQLKKPEFFKSWMTRILINCALAELRRNRRAIDHLDYPYKVIIIQKYFFDCKLNDIAELLEMPLGTVKVYHARAKEKLKRYLESG